MGSPESEKNRDSNEGPQWWVTIARSFAVGKFEVTFAEWDACVSAGGCSHRPETEWGRGKQPVMRVSWDDTQQYVGWLSRHTGKTYRLLTEAEWEYAARAWTTTRYAFGDTISKSQAQFSEGTWGSAGKTVAVGSFRPNAFGLYDMHGNVWEWVQDCWNDSYNGARRTDRRWQPETAAAGSFVAAPGTTIRGTSARRAAAGAPPSIGTSIWASVSGGCLALEFNSLACMRFALSRMAWT